MKRREAVQYDTIEGMFRHAETFTQGVDNVSINSEEDFETTTSDREAEERERLLKHLEEERKLRISLGKISYNCPEIKLPKILTSLHQKEVSFIADESPVQVRVKKPKKNAIKLPIFEYKPRKADEEPSYMRSTISHNLGRHDAKNERDYDMPIHNISPRDKSTVMDPTKTYLSKISNKRSLSIDEGNSRNTSSSLRKSSPKVISVSIQDKNLLIHKKKKRFEISRQSCTMRSDKDIFSTTLPDISTHYNKMPQNVKPRIDIMKGFGKIRKIPEYVFDI